MAGSGFIWHTAFGHIGDTHHSCLAKIVTFVLIIRRSWFAQPVPITLWTIQI